jgi:hypothetical protein
MKTNIALVLVFFLVLLGCDKSEADRSVGIAIIDFKNTGRLLVEYKEVHQKLPRDINELFVWARNEGLFKGESLDFRCRDKRADYIYLPRNAGSADGLLLLSPFPFVDRAGGAILSESDCKDQNAYGLAIRGDFVYTRIPYLQWQEAARAARADGKSGHELTPDNPAL